jgi:hypothetical protein
MPRNTPTEYLRKYKHSQRPRRCDRCNQNAYYYHPEWHYLCAPHLLDLINIGGLLWDWDDYPEMWERTGRLLKRSSGANATVSDSSNYHAHNKEA